MFIFGTLIPHIGHLKIMETLLRVTPFLHGIQKMFAWRIGIYQVHIPHRNHGASDPMNGESHHLGNHGTRLQWMQ
jgi:hypothetical protein